MKQIPILLRWAMKLKNDHELWYGGHRSQASPGRRSVYSTEWKRERESNESSISLLDCGFWDFGPVSQVLIHWIPVMLSIRTIFSNTTSSTCHCHVCTELKYLLVKTNSCSIVLATVELDLYSSNSSQNQNDSCLGRQLLCIMGIFPVAQSTCSDSDD